MREESGGGRQHSRFVRGVAIAITCCFLHAGLHTGLAYAEDAEHENTKYMCTDREDNDGDGLVDCADPDCHVFRVCQDYAPPPRRGAPVDSGPAMTIDANGCPEPKREIQSVPKAALGGVLIPIGLIMIGGSIPLFLGINYSTDTFSGRLPDGSSFTTKIGFGYSCSADVPCNTSQADAHAHDVPYLVGGLILSLAGIASTSIGGWLLYTGLQPKKQRLRPSSLGMLTPDVGVSTGGISVGLSGRF